LQNITAKEGARMLIGYAEFPVTDRAWMRSERR
jgi:hypothetical protein